MIATLVQKGILFIISVLQLLLMQVFLSPISASLSQSVIFIHDAYPLSPLCFVLRISHKWNVNMIIVWTAFFESLLVLCIYDVLYLKVYFMNAS